MTLLKIPSGYCPYRRYLWKVLEYFFDFCFFVQIVKFVFKWNFIF